MPPVPRRPTTIVLGAVVVALATATGFALRGGGAPSVSLPLAPLATIGQLRAPGPIGALGPEEVPIPPAPAPTLARPRHLVYGQRIDGISCQPTEQVLFHIHAHLTIFVHGAPRQIPAGIGIARPYEVFKTPAGGFITTATCFMWLHTHAADGIIHTESPIQRTYTLGDFFDIWGQPLDRHQVGSARGRVTALFNGRVFTGNPRQIPLLAHAQIQLEVGTPLLAPESISFPQGL